MKGGRGDERVDRGREGGNTSISNCIKLALHWLKFGH